MIDWRTRVKAAIGVARSLLGGQGTARRVYGPMDNKRDRKVGRRYR